MSNIFVSYASEDRARAEVLAGALERQGWSVWWDRKIPPGKQFSQIIEEEIDNAKCVIVLWSETSVGSKWVRNEAREGARREILVPALIDNVDIPLEFSGTVAANLVDWEGTSPHTEFDRLLKAVRAIVDRQLLPKEPKKRQDSGMELLTDLSRDPATAHSQLSPQRDSEVPSRDALDHSKPTGLETEKAGSKSRMAKVLAVICFVTLITIVSIGVFLKDRQPEAGTVLANPIGMKLVYIPASSFMMGSSRSAAQLAREHDTKEERFTDEFPQHQVRISKGFWMGQTEVTQGQYESVMNAQPWSGQDYVQEDANNPAVYVSWDDAVEFCRKLSQQEGKTYRLPTEAEWEYACRAGTTTRFSFGDSDSSLGDYAWFDGNAYKAGQKHAHSVGQKKPNPWGLYDMHGNVLEWCSDWYKEDYYAQALSDNPKGPPAGTYHSLRGGSWANLVYLLRCSFRGVDDHGGRISSVGFRVVLSQL